jgi:hypothetical protein
LTHSDESNHNDPHNQLLISFSLFVMLTHNVSSRKSLNCDRFCTSNFNLLSSLQKGNNFKNEAIVGLFCESSRAFTHSQITIATIERPSRTSPGAPSVFSLAPHIALRSPRQVATAESPQTDAILMCREATSIRRMDSGSWAAAAATPARPPRELVRIEPHGVVTHGIDRGAEAAMAILVYRIGTRATRP